VPTLIFGHLLTGSNFDDDEKKTTGGRNGYGAKLANIFSSKFIVECCDSEQGLKFSQVFRNNMHTAEEPKITRCTSSEVKKGDYTKITFRPDLEKFNMKSLDQDAVALISKRAYDIAGSMGNSKGGKKLSVYLNNEKIPVKDFKSYLAVFDGIGMPSAFVSMDNFEVGVTVSSDGCFKQISFVNGIATTKGGGHVNFVADKVAKHIQPIVNKGNKGGSNITPAQIKNHLSLFVNCLVENPTFDSQTKENLTTKPSVIGKKVTLPDKFLKHVEQKEGIVESVMSYTKFKQDQALKRKGGTKKTKLTGISKLDDANHAGTSKSKDCTLIITEGDSAKSLAMSGLSVVGRDYYGGKFHVALLRVLLVDGQSSANLLSFTHSLYTVFPLKGKPLNVREATHAQIIKNQEIKNLIDIMGLKFGTTYDKSNIKSLRYGHLMIMADQDHDGSHIKGLVINFIHHFWPSLLDVPGFLQQFITPIVKCTSTKGKKVKTFFTLPEYEEWKESTGNNAPGWTTKYYKGLGTSTSAEAKEYFSNLKIHEIHFNSISDDIISVDEDMEDVPDADAATTGAELIDLAFSKKKVAERKQWLNSIEKDTFLNYSNAQKHGVNYSDFINKELSLYSNYDNARSIAHVMDGLKPSQRKILFSCFKKKLNKEIKVAQLAGYIGEHSAYHHGEASLAGAIIAMAQSYVGSNNVNLLYPSGQYGTRRMGGKDHASARYIFTRLEKIARAIFHPDDDALLNYLNDDGYSIEPDYYMPVIPLVLVNGTDGIGTGYSSTVLNHDPRDVIANLKKMINGEDPESIHPCYFGFKGEIIIGDNEGKYTITGKIERKDDTTLQISELPIKTWTHDYKSFLEEMMTGTDKSPGEINDFKEHHTDTSVAFTITASKENIDAFEKSKNGLEGKFKLSKALSSTNMTLFDVDGKIQKYKSTVDILRTFFTHRLDFYVKRKNMLLEKMKKELKILSNKERFIEEVCAGDLVVNNRKKADLLYELSERGYDLFPKDDAKTAEEDDEEDEIMEETSSDVELAKGYEYLLGLKLWTLTFERAKDIHHQKGKKEAEVAALESTTPESIWLSDLDELDTALVEKYESIEAKKAIRPSKKRTAKQMKKKTVAKKSTKVKTEADEWNSESEESDSDGAGSDSEDDFDVEASPPKKAKATDRSKAPSSKSSVRLSANGKQKIAVLGTRSQQRKSISARKSKAGITDMLIDSESDTSPKKMPAKKEVARRRKSSIVKQALQAEVELEDSNSESDASPKKMPARKKSSKKSPVSKIKCLGESDSESIEAGARSDSEDDFDLDTNRPPMKSKITERAKTSSSKSSSVRLSANGKQKIAVLGTRSQQRKSISARKSKAGITDVLIDSESDTSLKKVPAKKEVARRRKSSIVKQALQAEVELEDSNSESDASPTIMPARKKSSLPKIKYLGESDSESIEATPKPQKMSKKKVTKGICHFSSDESDDGYESPHDDFDMSSRGRQKLSKPKYSFADSDEDEFEF